MNAPELTDKLADLFYKANEGDRKAVRRIMDYDLFEKWLDWNVAFRLRLDAMNSFANCHPAIRGEVHPYVKQYETLFQTEGYMPEFRAQMESLLMEKVLL